MSRNRLENCYHVERGWCLDCVEQQCDWYEVEIKRLREELKTAKGRLHKMITSSSPDGFGDNYT